MADRTAVTAPREWWRARWFALACVLAAAIPLLWPAIPPMNDVPGHIGRYHLMAVLGDGGPLDRVYAIHWAAIGNLGVDLIVLALRPLMGVEAATKLVVLTIPMLSVAGFTALSRVVHGRLTAPAILAFPLAYAFPFQLGFVNYALAAALATLALSLWIALAERRRLRLALFVPIAGAIWLAHSFGWALLGLTCGAAEIALGRRRGLPWSRAIGAAALACLPLAWPVALMAETSAPLSGETGDWFNWQAKAQWTVSLLRERWKWWDVAGAAVLICALYGMIRAKTVRIDPVLAWPAALCLAGFVLLPRLFQGGAYVDMRLLPQAIALGLIACAPATVAFERRIAIGATAFFGMRIAVTTIAFALFADGQQAELRALDAMPPGSRTLVLVNEPCSSRWTNDRLGHIAGLAIARRDAFVNEQWALAGQQLIRPTLAGAEPFARDPSHLVYPASCEFITTDYDDALRRFDRRAFDHVWTIGFPVARARGTGLTPVWTSGRSALFAVRPLRSAPAQP